MKMNRTGNEFRPLLMLTCLLCGLILAACAGTATTPEDEGDRVVERAKGRWAALLAEDFETAYAYYSPGYRSTTSVVDFAFSIRSRRVKWTGAEYREHSCSENSCDVTFDVGFRVNKPVPGLDKWDGKNLTVETWVKIDGEWWYVINTK